MAVPFCQDASHEDGATQTLPATAWILESGINFSGSSPALVVPPCPCDSQRCRVFAKHLFTTAGFAFECYQSANIWAYRVTGIWENNFPLSQQRARTVVGPLSHRLGTGTPSLSQLPLRTTSSSQTQAQAGTSHQLIKPGFVLNPALH